MMRVLVIIAVTGFLVSVVCLCLAVGIAGPDAIARGAWSWGPGGRWNFGHGIWSAHGHHWRRDDDGPQATREIAWTGGDSLDVDLAADVSYTQGDGPAKLIVTGPRDAVADVEVEGGHLRYRDDSDHWANLTVVMTAPSVTRFGVSGSGKLAIANYRQDKLALDLSGNAEVTGKGETKDVDLGISGSANADLGELKTQSATVDISGSGEATLAPSDEAKLNISGSGDVTLLTHPPKLETDISGSGHIRQEDRPAAVATDTSAPVSGAPQP
jgi:hypothetical protein